MSLLPFVDREVLALLPRFDLHGHPTRHRTAAGPGFRPIIWISVFWGDFPALHFARAAFTPRGIAKTKGGKLAL